MSAAQRAYLTVIEWPEGLTHAERVERLVGASGLDADRAAMAVRQEPPLIAGLIDRADRRPILAQLERDGITAIAPSRDELRGVPEPLPAKRLIEAMGSGGALYMAEPWRGEGRGVVARDIRLLVRATLRDSSTTTSHDPSHFSAPPSARGYTGEAEVSGALEGQTARRSLRVRMTEMLDIYMRDGSRVRINGDKFSFDVLGEQRSYTDRRNMDALAVRLAEASPRALIDEGFARFKPPPDIRVDRFRPIGGASVRGVVQHGAFDFYSPWVAMVYARLLRRPG